LCLKEYGKALKKWVDTEKHFLDILSDQLDFHTYCLRKMTLRQYVKMLRFEDRVFGHQYYVRAAIQIVKMYLFLHDNPLERTKAEEDAYLATLSPDEQKKYLRKKKREEAKKAKEEEEKKLQQQQLQKAQQKKGKQAPVDDDPNGTRFLNVPDKLEEAHIFLQRLIQFAPDNLETHLLSFEIALRRKKYLVALRSMLKGRAIAPEDPQIHRNTVRLFSHVDPEMRPLVRQVIQEEQARILTGQTTTQFNDAYLKRHSKSLAGRHAYTDVAALLDGSRKEALYKALHDDISDTAYNALDNCIQVHKSLVKQAPALARSYFDKCHTAFPLATYFVLVVEEEDKEQEKQ